jgi:hypothetical protein
VKNAFEQPILARQIYLVKRSTKNKVEKIFRKSQITDQKLYPSIVDIIMSLLSKLLRPAV